MKKLPVAFMIFIMSLLLISSVSWAESEKEVIFSETFEGDLSRWKVAPYVKLAVINDYDDHKKPEAYEKDYIDHYLVLSGVGRTSIIQNMIYESETKNRLISPKFDVEAKKIYTFAYDKRSDNVSHVDFVFYDGKDEEIERITLSLSALSNSKKDRSEFYMPNLIWHSAYATATAPENAVKARVEIMSPIICDNVLILKGFAGFQPDIEKRIESNIHATDCSDIYTEKPDLIYFESFEEKKDEWTYSTPNSEKGIVVDDNEFTFGKKALKFHDKYANSAVGITLKTMPCTPGAKYTMEADMLIGENRDMCLYLKYFDKDGSQIHMETIDKISPTWNTFAIDSVAPENAHTLSISLASPKGSGNAYIDKLCFSKTDSEESEEDNTEITVEDTKDNSNKQFILTIGKKDANVFGTFKENDVAPMIKNGRTMLPARFVAENLGAEVIWNSNEPKKIIVRKDDTEIVMEIGSTLAYVNGEKAELDSPPFIENDRTYTPVRFICESLDSSVLWNGDTQQVTITIK